MIVMTFTIELESGLSFVLQSALPLASDRSPDETHRRGRSKRSYGHGRRRTEIPEAEPPTAHPSRWQGQRCQATEGCAEGLVRMCVSHAASNETRCARLGTGAGVRRPPETAPAADEEQERSASLRISTREQSSTPRSMRARHRGWRRWRAGSHPRRARRRTCHGPPFSGEPKQQRGLPEVYAVVISRHVSHRESAESGAAVSTGIPRWA